MKQSEFRAELVKIMPGYNWTVHKSHSPDTYLIATGIQSSGSNRLSTLRVERREAYAGSGSARYEVKSAGYGRRAPWLHIAADKTLARALRALQDHYERTASLYWSHAGHMKTGRKAVAAAPGKAQHSVPETTNEEANSFLRVADAGQFKDNAVAVRTAAVIIRSLLHRPALMQSIIRHRIGLTPEYEGQWHADLYGEDGEVQHHAEADTPDEAVRAVVALAAAPGKEGL
ncbi:hypothetical protein [Pseudomonas aeruginosa]|uniref:hypothetical protein n=1 Tax=Pseudomonas aeruginosa TaxID=287 RepID=UPI0039DFA4C4